MEITQTVTQEADPFFLHRSKYFHSLNSADHMGLPIDISSGVTTDAEVEIYKFLPFIDSKKLFKDLRLIEIPTDGGEFDDPFSFTAGPSKSCSEEMDLSKCKDHEVLIQTMRKDVKESMCQWRSLVKERPWTVKEVSDTRTTISGVKFRPITDGGSILKKKLPKISTPSEDKIRYWMRPLSKEKDQPYPIRSHQKGTPPATPITSAEDQLAIITAQFKELRIRNEPKSLRLWKEIQRIQNASATESFVDQNKPTESFSVQDFIDDYLMKQQGKSKKTLTGGSDSLVKNKSKDSGLDESDWVRFVQKQSSDRLSEETSSIFKAMRGLKAFKDITDYILKEVVSVVRYEIHPVNRAIFRQGDPGTAWYIIVKGSVKVFVTQAGQLEYNSEVATHSAGEGFGDLALVTEKPRAATVITNEDSEFLVVYAEDYKNIIKSSSEKDIKAKTEFLKRIPLFMNSSPYLLKRLATVLVVKQYSIGQVIHSQGTHLDHVYFIRKGRVNISKALNRPRDGKKVHVNIGEAEEYQYVGETCVPWDSKRPSIFTLNGTVPHHASLAKRYQSCPSTFTACSDDVEIFIVTAFDVRSTAYGEAEALHKLATNPWSKLTEGEMIAMYTEQIDARDWINLRQKEMDRFFIERSADPHMTAKRYKNMVKSLGRTRASHQKSRQTWR